MSLNCNHQLNLLLHANSPTQTSVQDNTDTSHSRNGDAVPCLQKDAAPSLVEAFKVRSQILRPLPRVPQANQVVETDMERTRSLRSRHVQHKSSGPSQEHGMGSTDNA